MRTTLYMHSGVADLTAMSRVVMHFVVTLCLVEFTGPWSVQAGYDPGGNYIYENQGPPTCLDGRLSCGVDAYCQRMLTNIPELCPRPGSCETKQHQQCTSVQRWLQLTPSFENCHCQLNSIQTPECVELRDSIFVDPCPEVYATPEPTQNSDRGYFRTHSRHSGRSHHSKQPRDSNYEHDYFDEEDTEFDYTETGTHKISCIGVRKNCLIDHECRQRLSDFRRLCRENKKKNECVATDHVGCFDMIQVLRPSGVFNCDCPIKKPETKQKCDRIQWRLANNTCLVTVPYILHSTRTLASTYDDLLSVVSDSRGPSKSRIHLIPIYGNEANNKGSSCVSAFHGCHKDATCHLKMAAYMNACEWNPHTHLCNKEHCLAAIRSFYLLVRPEKTLALLFCQCAQDDYKCEAVRQALYPTCATIEMPPPKCHEIIARCESDHDCRQRWSSYEQYCSYDKISGGCSQGPAMCRSAQVGIMGTTINTNCTCAFLVDDQLQECLKAERRLKHDNVCKEIAQMDFVKHITTTTMPMQPLWKDADVAESDNDRKNCFRHLGHKIPHYMDMPTFVRLYRNDSECSDLCHCATDGAMSCQTLPCPAPLSCRENQMSYAHGTNFERPDRGLCRCIKSEIVCARAKTLPYKQRTGLFLHVGYSISDRYLIEGHSSLNFGTETVAEKLGALLNKDTAQSLCKMSVYHEEPGNLVFDIKLASYENNPTDIRQTCLAPTQMLGIMINNRQGVAVTDAELSVIKLAETEMLQRSSRPLQSSTNVQPNAAAAAHTTIALSVITSTLFVSLCLSPMYFRGPTFHSVFHLSRR